MSTEGRTALTGLFGSFLGVALAVAIVTAIPGDQPLLSGILGIAFALVGGLAGEMLRREER